MGFNDIDKKARYEPNRVIRRLAENCGADISKATSDEHARKLITEFKAEKKTSTDEPLKGEIIPPTKNNGHDRHGWGPQIAINVPIPAVNVSAKIGPQWFDCVAHVKDALLFMVLGAALYAVAAKFVGL